MCEKRNSKHNNILETKSCEQILEESILFPGDDGDLLCIQEIEWLDKSLIKHGLEFFHKHLALYACTTILTMASLIITVKPICKIVFQSDKRLSSKECIRTFLRKLRGIDQFFNSLLQPEVAKKLFYKTRKVHALAVKRLNKHEQQQLPELLQKSVKSEEWMKIFEVAVKKDVSQIYKSNQETSPNLKENLDWASPLPFNQFSLIYMTAAFIGPVWLKPQLFGIKSRDDTHFRGLIHMWAVIANLLGLRDEFNIYINPDNDAIESIVKNVYLYSLTQIDSTIIILQKIVIDGINIHLPVLTQTAVMLLALETLGCKTKGNIWKLMGLRDKIAFFCMKGTFYMAGQFELVRLFTNWVFEKLISNLYVTLLNKRDRYS